MSAKGVITGVNGNMITVEFSAAVRQNEVAYAITGGKRLKAEVVRIGGNTAELQVFEYTRGFCAGDPVEFTGELLSVELGPGLLGRLYDGLQNPLYRIAEECGFFLEPGAYFPALPREKLWDFTPAVKPGDVVTAGDTLGTTPEGLFRHRIMTPFYMTGAYEVLKIIPAGGYRIGEQVAVLGKKGGPAAAPVPVTMSFNHPIKYPVKAYKERLSPTEPLITGIRIIDTLFPVAKGGTYCIPGPFGAGKTVLQQITSRNAAVDVVVIAACGERAGEVVETIKEFPLLTDPKTGRSLMERTIIVCNTSSMPIAARESSVYTAVTMAEYYRQMGLDVLLLADSTSRWAQAMRERSGRLEEIPGEEAFPAYLEAVIAAFYERAGCVRLNDGGTGSVTIGGTISPAGGSFEEPVTQATLKVVSAFHGLSRERSDARRYPAIDPIESWSKYPGIIDAPDMRYISELLVRANETAQMMKVVGEEGTALLDFVRYMKAEFFDHVYLQQNAFDPVDSQTDAKRQRHVFHMILEILRAALNLKEKDEARAFFNRLRQLFLDYNGAKWDSAEFFEMEKTIAAHVKSRLLEDTGRGAHTGKSFVESALDSDFRRSARLRIKDARDLLVRKPNETNIS